MISAERRRGLAAALGAYSFWGIFPLYFILIARVPTLEILSNRIFWSGVLVIGIVLARGRGPALLAALRSRRRFWGLFGSALCITSNWGFYAWAVPHGHALEAGFGYLVNPLITVLLGFAVLRERISLQRLAAILLAAAGVAVLALGNIEAAWLVIVLPLSFALYGLLRKLVPVDALVGLAVEVLLLAPFAGIYLATRPGGGALWDEGPLMTGMLLLAAPVTAVPLALFAYAARRLSMAAMGFLQYVSPTLQLLVAVLVLGQAFTWTHAASFSLIWLGIVIDWLPLGRRRAAPLAAPETVDIPARRGHMAEEAPRGPIAPTSNPEAP